MTVEFTGGSADWLVELQEYDRLYNRVVGTCHVMRHGDRVVMHVQSHHVMKALAARIANWTRC